VFLDTVLARNPRLVETAAALHRAGRVPPDTYVVDRDAVEANAALLAAEAARLGVALWFVAKHLGRNPDLVRAVARHIPAAAAIDAAEARAVRGAGARLGNVGHLVQIPVRALDEALAWEPEAVTVYDLANARAVGAAAARRGRVQPVLARVEGAPGEVYPGQEGGVPPEGLEGFAAGVARLPGVRLAGVTAFPCLLCDPGTGVPEPTATFGRLLTARRLLRSLGHDAAVLSAPSVTCAASLPLLAARGATHGEPGHALTGTTPLHAADPGQPEVPAYVYVSEVAHVLADGRPAVFGGGFYARSRVRGALVLAGPGAREVRLGVRPAPAGTIDYHRLLDAPGPGARVAPGDTAVFAFRTQIFVTRSTVAVVAGLREGRPRLVGLSDSRGRAL
jgi:predicted amino acid racemase